MAEIDWNLPLETTDGRPAEAVRVQREPPLYSVAYGTTRLTYDSSGRCAVTVPPWAPNIRNARPVRTADEALQHMEAFVRRLAEMHDQGDWFADEAREIVALLPEPVDPDIAEARRVANDHRYYLAHQPGHSIDEINEHIVKAIAAGVKRGRALAAS